MLACRVPRSFVRAFKGVGFGGLGFRIQVFGFRDWGLGFKSVGLRGFQSGAPMGHATCAKKLLNHGELGI